MDEHIQLHRWLGVESYNETPGFINPCYWKGVTHKIEGFPLKGDTSQFNQPGLSHPGLTLMLRAHLPLRPSPGHVKGSGTAIPGACDDHLTEVALKLKSSNFSTCKYNGSAVQIIRKNNEVSNSAAAKSLTCQILTCSAGVHPVYTYSLNQAFSW